VDIAREAGALAAARFAAGTTASLKPDGTELTPADIEERAAGGDSGRRWVIDPINGTTLFVRRIPTFDMLLELVAGLPTGPRPRP
jgi:hypothetical protein